MNDCRQAQPLDDFAWASHLAANASCLDLVCREGHLVAAGSRRTVIVVPVASAFARVTTDQSKRGEEYRES